MLTNIPKNSHTDKKYFIPQAIENIFSYMYICNRYASELGVIIVNPDTSPRGEHIPDDPDSWDFGIGAGYFVNATKEPWKKNFKMYDYFMKEFQEVIEANFPVNGEKAVMGHRYSDYAIL